MAKPSAFTVISFLWLSSSTTATAAAPESLLSLRGGGVGRQQDERQDLQSLRIVGGKPVYRDSSYSSSFAFPTGIWACGATLIYEDILVTAAHCDPAQVFADSVRIGGIQRNGHDAKETIAVSASRKHPNYDDRSVENDIMVLKLAHPSTAPVTKWNTNKTVPADGETVKVIGFGTTSYQGDLSNELLEVDLDILDFKACNKVWKDLDENTQICAAKDFKDSCQGDSGGPLLNSDGVLVGLVSFGGAGCGTPGTPPGVYTRLSGFDDFLTKSICEMSANPPSSCRNTATATAPPPPGTSIVFIDAGSASEDTSLITMNRTEEIFSFIGRQPSLGAFNTIRYNWISDLIYTIPNLKKSSRYTVKLGWAEIYDHRIGCVEGFREFDVLVQNTTVEKDLDVYKMAGCATSLVKEYNTTSNTAGQIVITFKRKTYWPMVSLIEILTT